MFLNPLGINLTLWMVDHGDIFHLILKTLMKHSKSY